MVKVSALLLLIAFVANPKLYSLFSVSEHPMQAGSTVLVQSLKNFFVCPVCVCVCVGGGGGGGGGPLPPPPVSATDYNMVV